MASWHERDCRRPDVVLMDDTPTCLSCGSFFLHNDDEAPAQLNKQTAVVDESYFPLKLDWPSSITFISSEDVTDPNLKRLLRKLDRCTDSVSQDADSQTTLSENEDFMEEHVVTAAEGDQNAVAGSSQDLADRLTVDKPTEEYGTETSNKGLNLEVTSTNVEVDSANPNPLYHSLMGTDEIRLLLLDPYDILPQQPLHGYLVPTRLSQRPDYVALSYTWADKEGDRTLREKIFLGRAWTPFAITSNCAAALRRLRSRGGTRTVWVDAICIDQTNIGERSHQVSIMRDIYSRAESVAIFLGGETDQSVDTPAGRLIQRLSEERFRAGRAVKKDWGGDFDYHGICELFEQPYWSRIWVIQEVLLARTADIILGNASISLHEFIENFMKQLPESVEHFLPLWIYFIGDSHKLRDVDAFSSLLDRTSMCKSSDKRDMVFALFGLVQGAKLDGLVADYSKTMAEIYTGLAAYFLIRHGQSELIKAAASVATSAAAAAEIRIEKRLPGTYHPHTKLPSWVPFAKSPDPLEMELLLDLKPPTLEDWCQILNARIRKLGLSEDYHLTGVRPGNQETSWTSISKYEVFGNGTLLIRASPIVHISSKNVGWVQGAFSATTEKNFGGNICLLGSKRTSNKWDICVHSYHSLAGDDDWVIEVPGCDTFLHLKPSGRASGTYEIASFCSVLLARHYNTPESSASSGQDGPLFDDSPSQISNAANDYRFWMPLVSYELQDLLFLRHWETLSKNDSLLSPSEPTPENSLARLTPEVLEEYGRWLELSPIPRSGNCRHDDFDPVVKTVSLYLERWKDPQLWSRIDEIVVDVRWRTKLWLLASIRADAWEYLAMTDQLKVGHSRNWDDIHLGSRLQELFDGLAICIPRISLPETEGTQSLPSFMSWSKCLSLRKSLEDIPGSWTWDEIRDKETEIFEEWTALESCWKFLERSQVDCYALRGKFVQLRALRRLCGREHRDFLIC